MMNSKEYLLVVLMEELSELQHAVSKCIRFTPEDKYIKKETTNLEDVIREFSDVSAIIQMLRHRGIEIKINEKAYVDKVYKTIRLMNYSRKLGVLEKEDLDFNIAEVTS